MAEIPTNPEHANFRVSYTESQDDREPFVIRGHHIPNFILLENKPFNNKLGPAMEANYITYRFKRARRKKIKTNYPVEEMLGTTRKEARKFTNDLTEQFKRYVDLPDDYPVRLTSHQRDVWCKVANNGEHCYKNIVDKDSVWVDKFIKDSQKLSVGKDKLKIFEEMANFSDTEPEMVKEVLTTLGVVKHILRNSKIEIEKHGDTEK